MASKIMVVDDEQDVKLLFEQKFRREVRSGAVEFRFAFSGEDALSQLRSMDAADLILILSDINMPGMTGIELLKEIKREMPARRVIMITAYGDAETHRMALTYGADDLITKPIDFDVLRQHIGLTPAGHREPPSCP